MKRQREERRKRREKRRKRREREEKEKRREKRRKREEKRGEREKRKEERDILVSELFHISNSREVVQSHFSEADIFSRITYSLMQTLNNNIFPYANSCYKSDLFRGEFFMTNYLQSLSVT